MMLSAKGIEINNYNILNNLIEGMQKRNYISCIKISGVPILPPMMTSQRREEMLRYKNLAMEIEKKLKLKRNEVQDECSNISTISNYMSEQFQDQESSIEEIYDNSTMKLTFDNISSHDNRNTICQTDFNLLPYSTLIVVPSSDKSEITHSNIENQVPNLDNNLKHFLNKQVDIRCYSCSNKIIKNSFEKSNSSNSQPSYILDNNEQVFSDKIFQKVTNESMYDTDIDQHTKEIFFNTENLVNITTSNELTDEISSESIKDTNCDNDHNEVDRSVSAKSNIPLIRQNSYTLDSPSPILLAMMDQLKINDIYENTSIHSTREHKRPCWDLEKAKEKWSSMENIGICFATNNSKILTKKYDRDKNNINPLSNNILPMITNVDVSKSAENVSKTNLDIKQNKICKIISITPKSRTLSRTLIGSKCTINKKKIRKMSPNTPKIDNIEIPTTHIGGMGLEQKLDSIQKDENEITDSNNFTEDTSKLCHYENEIKISHNSTFGSEDKYLETSNNKQSTNSQPNNMFSKDDVKNLFIQIQTQHSNQMAELVERQKKEQENLNKFFNEQQQNLVQQIQTSFPMLLNIPAANNILDKKDHYPADIQHLSAIPSDINEINSRQEVFTQNKEEFRFQNKSLHDPNECNTPKSVTTDSLNIADRSMSKDSLNDEDFDTNSEITIVPDISSSRSSYKERHSDIFLDLQNLHIMRSITNFNEKMNGHINCSRELFPTMLSKKSYSTKELKATVTLQAATRGFLVRRLFRTERVQTLIKTVKDTLLCALELHHEDCSQIKPADVELHRRLIQQLTSACYSLHDVFFSTSIQEKMSIISLDRRRLLEQLSRSSSARSTPSLSATTRKVIQRKRQLNSHAPTIVSSVNYKTRRSMKSELQMRSRAKSLGSWPGSALHSSAPNTTMTTSIGKKPWR